MKKAFLYAYDRQNLGDDLFVHAITGRYPNTQFYMWSDRKNQETFSCLPNLTVIDKDSRFVHLLHKLRPSLVARYRAWLEKRCNAVVYIGGSIFMEYPNWGSSAPGGNMKRKTGLSMSWVPTSAHTTPKAIGKQMSTQLKGFS